MTLRFIVGRSGTDKSGFMFEEIKKKSLQEPQGPPIFYIVPDQMTFDQEYTLFRDPEFTGSIRTQVVSFSRLAWRIFQETGGATRQYISSVGIQMLLRKILKEKQGEWLVFQKATEKQGFLDQLEAIMTEFKRYEITPNMLLNQQAVINQFVHRYPAEKALVNKLDDLTYIYDRLITTLKDTYIDGEDELRLLAEKIPQATLMQEAEVYLDGFHRFTPIELRVIEALLKTCRKVTIALTVDNPEKENVSELDLFYQTTETYHQLKQLAAENQISIEPHIRLEAEKDRFQVHPYFAHLEKHFDTRPVPEYVGEVPVKLGEAVHPRAEIEGVAQEILTLVRDNDYRFRDIAIFIREPETYHDLIDTIFTDYDIPVFIDDKRSMLNHSLIEFIRSILDVIHGNWRYDAVFRMLKTGFIPIQDERYPLTADAIDELENYCLEYGIRSRSSWFSDDEWVFQRFRGFERKTQTDDERDMQQKINRYRAQVVEPLRSFDEAMRQAETIQERCELIYLLLEKLQVPRRLEQLRSHYDEAGQIEKGREQEQVWHALIQLFDEIVEMAGDENMPFTIFREMIEAGLASLKFAHVPPSMDHVIVGSVDRSRISGKKCTFLLGVNEGLWPLKPPADSVINEEERELLAHHGMKLADTTKRQLLDDWFYMYLVFTSASEFLWVSYPISDEEGKAKMPSQLIRKLEQLFPEGMTHLLLQDPDELIEAERFITTPEKTRAALTAQLSRYVRGYPMKEIWWHVLNWYIINHPKNGTSYNVLQSLFYENKPTNLSQTTVKKLYPKKIKASVSRLETYYRCSFQHFARYSLGLQERRTYKLDAPDIGQLFHEALKIITEWVQEEGTDYALLTKDDANGYAKRAVRRLAPVLQHQILYSSNRYQYIQKKLQQVIARATFILSEQARKSDFSPIGLELGFGLSEKSDLPPISLTLPNGYELILRGQIDRVDRAQKDEQLYLRIIDYKSSDHSLNLLEVYYGLALQMLAYLDVVLAHSEQWLGIKASPAGVLYFHVHNPMISGKPHLNEQALEKEIFKQYKMKGLLIADEGVVQLMDTSLESGTSQIIPAGLKKNGGFYSHSKVADQETFSILQEHIHQLMRSAGLDMTGGNIELNPFKYKNRDACTYCPFKSVCQFDPLTETNAFHKLSDMKDDEVLAKLRKEREE
ncbi:MAG TPA: helicase-exonuclease AddAB subunit AddB [Cerasibacillus sp.]|uniref:helicase-exonuclease AddAB subunit AddB n=1 Tax=Cerasibacillus sp. TaxID=2498711 RepID=UPI002F41F632